MLLEQKLKLPIIFSKTKQKDKLKIYLFIILINIINPNTK
jgi:hypothetical protein